MTAFPHTGLSPTDSIIIRRLFISAAHNYFGHHGQPAGTSPNIEVSEIDCVAGRGIAGDRFLDYKDDYKGQITFFSAEVFRYVCARLGVSGLSSSAVRRNVITENIDLNSLIGKRFQIQGVEFEGVCECKPCYWMDQAIAPGAEELLKGRGGLRAKIVSSGKIRVTAT